MLRMGHVCIAVKNLEEAIAWYEKVFQFQLKAKYTLNEKRIAFISLTNATNNQIELLEETSLKASPVTSSPLHHFCIETTNFNVLYEKLKEQGIKFTTNTPQKTGQKKSTIYLEGINSERIQLLEV